MSNPKGVFYRSSEYDGEEAIRQWIEVSNVESNLDNEHFQGALP